MITHEYDGFAVYYVQGFSQVAFPLSRSGSSLPSSLIHCIRDKSILVETTYEPTLMPSIEEKEKDGAKMAKTEDTSEQSH